jgi:hypothetical protein
MPEETLSFDEAQTAERRPAHIADSLRLSTLIRTADPARSAAMASRRLANVVAEWQPAAALRITIGATLPRGRVEVAFTQLGQGGTDWQSDIRWALADIAELKAAQARHTGRPLPRRALELRPERELDAIDSRDDFVPPTESSSHMFIDFAAIRQRNLTPWPVGKYSDMNEVLGLLSSRHDLAIRILLAPATELEKQMVNDSLRASWTGPDADLASYQGIPLRVRTLVSSYSGEVPARLQALLRRWGTSVRLQTLTNRQLEEVWTDGSRTLAGHVVPEDLAMALIHLPAAGHASVAGIPTRHTPMRVVPLDPWPAKPAHPVRLGRATTVSGRQADIGLDVQDFLRHIFIEGATGAGKSTLLTALVRGLSEIGCGYTLLDAHGATIDAAVQALPASALQKVDVIRHGDPEHPVPLDILTGSTEELELGIDVFTEMVQSMYDPRQDGIVGPRWRRWFGLIARATAVLFGERASLVHVTAIASDMRRVRSLADRIREIDPELSHRLINEYARLADKEATELVSWGVSKLHPLVSSSAMRAILGTGADAVDVKKAMEDGRGLLIDLATPTLGAPSSRLLGALWLLKHQLAMGKRNNPQQPHVLIVDEAHLFAYGALPTMLAEGRKFGVGVVIADQTIDALDSSLKDALEANSGSFVSLRSGLRNASRAATRLNQWPIEQLIRLPDLVAAATLSRDGIMTEPFTLTIDHHARMKRLAAHNPPAAERAAMLQDRSRERLWAPHRGLQAPSDLVIMRELATPPEDEEPPAMRPAPKPQQSRPSDYLDDWLKTRRAARTDGSVAAAGARTDEPDGKVIELETS